MSSLDPDYIAKMQAGLSLCHFVYHISSLLRDVDHITAQEFVYNSEIRLKGSKSQNSRSSSRRREGMEHRNFISGVKICFHAY